LAPLLDPFLAVLDDLGANPDLLRVLLSLRLRRRHGLAGQGNSQLPPMKGKFSFHRLPQIPN
jgi:hypothetical protein